MGFSVRVNLFGDGRLERRVKIDCAGIRSSSYEYLRGQLGPAEERDTEAHLQGCPGCKADLESTRTCLAPLQDLPEFEPAPLTWNTIETRLPRRASAFSGSIRVAAAASLLVAIASFAVVLSLSDSQPTFGTGRGVGVRVRQHN